MAPARARSACSTPPTRPYGASSARTTTTPASPAATQRSSRAGSPPCWRGNVIPAYAGVASTATAAAPDGEDEPGARDRRADEPEQAEYRQPQERRAAPHRQHDGRTHDQRCQHHADGQPVGGVLDLLAEALQVVDVDVQLEAAGTRRTQQALEVARESRQQLPGVDEHAQAF